MRVPGELGAPIPRGALSLSREESFARPTAGIKHSAGAPAEEEDTVSDANASPRIVLEICAGDIRHGTQRAGLLVHFDMWNEFTYMIPPLSLTHHGFDAFPEVQYSSPKPTSERNENTAELARRA